MKTHKGKVIFLAMALVLLVLFGVFYGLARAGFLPMPSFLSEQAAPWPAPANTRDGRWAQAVEYLGSQLPSLHVNPYFKVSEAEFQKTVDALSEQIPSLNDEQVTVGMMRIVASIGDGHTRMYPYTDETSFSRLPLEMRWLSDGLVVIAADPQYEQVVGAKVVQIGAHPVEAVYEAVKPLVAADNEMQVWNDTAVYMEIPAILYGLDLIPQNDRATFRFEAQDGSQFDLELLPFTGDPAPFVSVYKKAGVQPPLYEQDRKSLYWVRHLPESNVVYVQYNACQEQKDRPFISFTREVFDLVDQNPGSRLVLDVRFNGGGAEGVLKPFLQALEARPEFSEPGRLYVIIGRGTYSSALQNAITLRREYNATLVGEPTGGKPNHYGEVRSFDLPNVGFRVWYSTRYWLNYPEGDPLSLEPDRPVHFTLADLLAGSDPALEAALQP